ncbi:cysteine hydrolase family protein [Mesorhizobium sp. WSM4307]|uniref:cysteine hydrolase family protein n=1 Tax=Mesorhizobium sp. WSM4307 TaxID=2589884 RepID=UPI001FEE7EE5|nr:cysteine hydrolase family protein [Mesorhizobium sp. WSM4307]
MSAPANITPRRALIVIDVQNDYDGGNLAIQHPPFRDSVVNVARAMDAAAAAGIKVVVIKQMAPESSPIFAKSSHGGELHPEIARRGRDHYVEKTLPSAFTGTDLEAWLRANAIDTLTVVGYMTHNCDLSTIIHAVHMGFAVEFLSDATGSVPYANSAGYASGRGDPPRRHDHPAVTFRGRTEDRRMGRVPEDRRLAGTRHDLRLQPAGAGAQRGLGPLRKRKGGRIAAAPFPFGI